MPFGQKCRVERWKKVQFCSFKGCSCADLCECYWVCFWCNTKVNQGLILFLTIFSFPLYFCAIFQHMHVNQSILLNIALVGNIYESKNMNWSSREIHDFFIAFVIGTHELLNTIKVEEPKVHKKTLTTICSWTSHFKIHSH